MELKLSKRRAVEGVSRGILYLPPVQKATPISDEIVSVFVSPFFRDAAQSCILRTLRIGEPICRHLGDISWR